MARIDTAEERSKHDVCRVSKVFLLYQTQPQHS